MPEGAGNCLGAPLMQPLVRAGGCVAQGRSPGAVPPEPGQAGHQGIDAWTAGSHTVSMYLRMGALCEHPLTESSLHCKPTQGR
jgi:hypothetical protein